MLDQSFSAENFRRILDLENRKGVYLEGRFFPNLNEITEQMKQCTKDIMTKRKNKATKDESYELYKQRKVLKDQKEEKLNSELEKVSKKVLESDFNIDMEQKVIPGEKPIYITKDTPEHFFALKQVQANVSRLFGIKQSNRFAIVSQVKNLLNDKLPKYVLRTDIDDFYENIPQKYLLDKINRDNLLTPFSRKILRQILKKYRELSGSDKGIPRGIGVSAYFAELYMRDIDKEIMAMDNVTYFARYVDDIIIIFIPSSRAKNVDYLKKLKKIVAKYKLKLNDRKTLSRDLLKEQQLCSFEYLGYKFFFGNGEVKTRFPDRKIEKYKSRINLAFNHYLNLSRVNEKEARNILVKRIRFLTGNTRLKNNKENIMVGIYYSNSQLSEKNDFKKLDRFLRTKIDEKIDSPQLRERLKRYNFKDSFETRRFSPFKAHELQEIMKIW